MDRRGAIFGAMALVALAACAPRGRIVKAPTSARIGHVQHILVASSRRPQQGTAAFSRYPAAALNFAEFDVSVPPSRDPGTVAFPRGSAPTRSAIS